MFRFGEVDYKLLDKVAELLKAMEEEHLRNKNIDSRVVLRFGDALDFGGTEPVWSQNLNVGWNTTYSFTTPDDSYFSIIGLFNYAANPLTTEVRIRMDAGYVRKWTVDMMYSIGNPFIFFYPREILLIPPNSRVDIEQYAFASGTDYFGFLVVVAEPEGKNLQLEYDTLRSKLALLYFEPKKEAEQK